MENSSTSIFINEKYFEGMENIDILSVFGKEQIEYIQNIISNVTGLSFVTVDYKGEPVTETTNFTTFCKKMRADEKRQNLCKVSDASGTIIAATSKCTNIYFCPCGLLEVAIPIIVNDRYLGGFIGGQVICTDAPEHIMRFNKNMSTYAKDLEDVDIKNDKYKQDIKEIKKYTFNEFVQISKLIELIINQLTKKELISEHHKMKNLNKIKKLQQKVRELEYENNILDSKYNDLLNTTNIFFNRNMFTMISNLSIIEGANRTNDAILKYSNFIMNEIEKNKDNSIRKAIERVENIIQINNIRYDKRISYDIFCESDILDEKMPFSILLPFVQSSIYYSMNAKEQDYNINIHISKDENDIKIQMKDTGIGLSISEMEQMYTSYKENHEGSYILKSLKTMMNKVVNTFGKNYKTIYEPKKDSGTYILVRYPINFDEKVENV